MPYITSVERIGIQQGLRQGLLEGMSLDMRLKFGSEGLGVLPEISRIQDVGQFRAILSGLQTVNTLD